MRRPAAPPGPGCGRTRPLHPRAQGALASGAPPPPRAPELAVEAAVVWALWGLRLRSPDPLGAGQEVLAARPTPWWLPLLYGNGAALVALWTGRLAAGSLPW